MSLGLFLFLSLFLVSPGFSQESSSNSSSSSSNEKDASAVDVKSILSQDLGGSEGEFVRQVPTSRGTPLATLENYQGGSTLTNGKDLSAVNPDLYSLQPGDSISYELWTPYHIKGGGVVSSFGTLNINPIGEVAVGGVLLRDLSTHLQSQLKQYYKDIHVTANLNEVRSVKVQVLGEVKSPGAYEMSGVSGVLDAVGKAGGLTDRSSLRQIELRKGNQVTRTLDYFKWRVFGDERESPYVEPNEIIYVPVIKNRVMVEGEVRRPGSYEVRPNETYADLVQMAGGYTPEAVVGEVKLSRVKDSRSKTSLPITDALALQDGDSVYVPPLALFMKKIKVMGELNGVGLLAGPGLAGKAAALQQQNQVGWYRLRDNQKVRDVVLDLGGLTPRADPTHARIERKDARGALTILPVNLQKLFAQNDETQNLALEDGDSLVVPASPNVVFVMGEVGAPAAVPYAPGNQVREYLALAGGPSSHSNLKHVKLIRQAEGTAQPTVYTLNLQDSLLGKTSQANVPVEPGDVIYVPKSEVSGLSDVIGLITNYGIFKALFFR